MKNALSIDLEYWFSAEFLRGYLPETPELQIEEPVELLLNLFERYQVKGTFFVLGAVAENNPDMIKWIHDEGHEIACHSYSHRTLNDLGPIKFEEELKKSTQLLSAITSERPLGFRAPSFSLDRSTSWLLKILEKYDYKYDSSIFPIKNMLYGIPDAPRVIYKPLEEDITKNDENGKIIEFPLTTIRLIRNIPVSGGFYFRALPYGFIDYSYNLVNRKIPGVLYIHPWEINHHTPRVNMPVHKKFITYYGINQAYSKLERLLANRQFVPMREVLGI